MMIRSPVSRAKSPEVLLERPLFTLSTFKPSKDNVKVLKNGSLSLKIAPSEVSIRSYWFP